MNKNKQSSTTNNSINPEDDAFFDNYLQGKSTLSELYQNTDCAPPSQQLDQKILNAAQKSTTEEKAKTGKPPIAWAASIAIFSLVGLLTLNTWQTEQETLPLPSSEADTHTDSANFIQQESFFKKSNKEAKTDTRQLLYPPQPAPVIHAAPKKITGMKANHENISSPVPETVQNQVSFRLTEQEIELNKIQALIKQDKLDKAHELFLKFRIKYPNYIVAPEILQKIAPN